MHVKVCFPHLLNFVWVWRQKQQAHVIFQPKNISKVIRDIFMSIFFSQIIRVKFGNLYKGPFIFYNQKKRITFVQFHLLNSLFIVFLF